MKTLFTLYKTLMLITLLIIIAAFGSALVWYDTRVFNWAVQTSFLIFFSCLGLYLGGKLSKPNNSLVIKKDDKTIVELLHEYQNKWTMSDFEQASYNRVIDHLKSFINLNCIPEWITVITKKWKVMIRDYKNNVFTI